MEHGKIFFNKIVIGTKIVQYAILMAGVLLLLAHFCGIIPKFPTELRLFHWAPLIFGICLTLAGLIFVLGGPVVADDCLYKQYRYLKKEELNVYYDMGHKIWIAFENQGVQCTGNLKKIRALDRFRVAYYYTKKDGEPVMRQLELL